MGGALDRFCRFGPQLPSPKADAPTSACEAPPGAEGRSQIPSPSSGAVSAVWHECGSAGNTAGIKIVQCLIDPAERIRRRGHEHVALAGERHQLR